MMRVVVDINVLLKMAAAAERSPLLLAWLESRFTLFMSTDMMDEFTTVLNRPKIQRFVYKNRGERFKAFIQSRAVFVELASDYLHCRDPKDDMVIATAVSAQATYLITADKDLYDDPDLVAAMKNLGVHILTPAQFLKQLPD